MSEKPLMSHIKIPLGFYEIEYKCQCGLKIEYGEKSCHRCGREIDWENKSKTLYSKFIEIAAVTHINRLAKEESKETENG